MVTSGVVIKPSSMSSNPDYRFRCGSGLPGRDHAENTVHVQDN